MKKTEATTPILEKVLKVCLGLVIVAILGAAGFFAYIGYSISKSFDESLKPVTDLSRYTEIKNEWQADLVGHFPKQAPEGAVFHFHPGFLQGGASLQLKVEVAAAEARRALELHSKQALAKAQGGNTNTHQNETKGLPSTFFYTGSTKGEAFPEDYTILILKAEAHGGEEAPWNHGESTGVAVSTQRNSIVYWAEDW